MPDARMSAVDKAASMGVHRLSPYLVVSSAADAIDFYKAAFEAVELIRLPGPDGKLIHACLSINGSSVMLTDELCMPMGEVADRGSRSPRSLGGTAVTMHLVVDDVDAVFQQAVRAGATVAMPVADMFWGDRYGAIEDPFGHHWSIATPIRNLSEHELKQATLAAFSSETEK